MPSLAVHEYPLPLELCHFWCHRTAQRLEKRGAWSGGGTPY